MKRTVLFGLAGFTALALLAWGGCLCLGVLRERSTGAAERAEARFS